MMRRRMAGGPARQPVRLGGQRRAQAHARTQSHGQKPTSIQHGAPPALRGLQLWRLCKRETREGRLLGESAARVPSAALPMMAVVPTPALTTGGRVA